LVLKRVLLDRRECPIHSANEIGTEPWVLLIIPVAGFGDFGFGLRFEYQLAVHL